MLRAAGAAAAVIALSLLAPTAHAQDPAAWPARAVRLVVPSSPGGGTDLYARLLAQGLTEGLRQSFIVDNRPGAAGNPPGPAARPVSACA